MEGEPIRTDDSEDLAALQLSKTDIVFYQAYKKNILSTFLFILLNAFACSISFFWLTRAPSLTLFLQVSLIVNVVAAGVQTTIYTYLYQAFYSSPRFYYDAAVQTSHIVKNQPLESLSDDSTLELLTSSHIYIGAEDMREDLLDKDKKKVYLKVTRRQIWSALETKATTIKKAESFRIVLALVGLIAAIVVLFSQDLAIEQKVFLVLLAIEYVTLCAPAICCLVCLVCTPLCCLACLLCSCFLWCCDGRNLVKPKEIDLAVQSAGTEQVINAGGDCSICYMSIKEGDSIYVLPCSQKHVYHSSCLSHWTRIKSTCPICRGEIPMASSSGHSEE